MATDPCSEEMPEQFQHMLGTQLQYQTSVRVHLLPATQPIEYEGTMLPCVLHQRFDDRCPQVPKIQLVFEPSRLDSLLFELIGKTGRDFESFTEDVHHIV
jgi:hypothetical protein